MKKQYSFYVFFAVLSMYQPKTCDPDTTITEPGIYPEYLDTAVAGSPYQHTLQILAVKDTTVVFMGNTIVATVDSIKIIEINGLPATFMYACEPANCVYTGDSVGCAVLDGNPVSADIGEHPLEIIITSYARYLSFQLPVTDTITDFVLVVNDTGMVSVTEKVLTGFKVSNPSSMGLFQYSSDISLDRIVVKDLNGRQVHYTNNPGKTGTIDLSACKSGLYFLVVESPNGRIVKRLIHP